ncbi:MAG: FtsX-like permease family protein [Planctomycetota bacterium]
MSSVVGMILKELRFRPLSALLVLITVAAASALVVFYHTGSLALRAQADEAEDATRKIQKAMGTNLTLIPAATDLADYYDAGGVAIDTVDESVIDRLVAQDAVSMNHLIPMLEARIELAGRNVLLTGIAPSQHTPGRPKKKMNDGVEPGSLELGSAVAEAMGVATGDTIELLGESLYVALVYVPKGTAEDLRVYANLADAQRMLGKEGQINKIEALDCVSCADPEAEALGILRDELAVVAPELQVQRDADVANARVLQRALLAKQTGIIERFHGVMLPVILIGVPIAIGAITMLNVRDRKNEIGVLRALGKGSCSVGALFLGKALLLAAVGAAIGVAVGWALVSVRGPGVFDVEPGHLRPENGLLLAVLIAAPVFAVLAAALPAVWAVTQHPADAMRED